MSGVVLTPDDGNTYPGINPPSNIKALIRFNANNGSFLSDVSGPVVTTVLTSTPVPDADIATYSKSKNHHALSFSSQELKNALSISDTEKITLSASTNEITSGAICFYTSEIREDSQSISKNIIGSLKCESASKINDSLCCTINLTTMTQGFVVNDGSVKITRKNSGIYFKTTQPILAETVLIQLTKNDYEDFSVYSSPTSSLTGLREVTLKNVKIFGGPATVNIFSFDMSNRIHSETLSTGVHDISFTTAEDYVHIVALYLDPKKKIGAIRKIDLTNQR